MCVPPGTDGAGGSVNSEDPPGLLRPVLRQHGPDAPVALEHQYANVHFMRSHADVKGSGPSTC